jgi:hypothetical protein
MMPAIEKAVSAGKYKISKAMDTASTTQREREREREREKKNPPINKLEVYFKIKI